MVTRRRGYTLVEVLVASAVSLVLLTAMYRLLVQGGIIFLRSEARVDLQAAGLAGLEELSSELRLSAFAYLTIDASGDPPALAFRLQDPHGSDPVFNPEPHFVVYYRDASRRALMRKIWGDVPGDSVSFTPDPLSAGARLSALQLAQICQTPNGTERPVARMVDTFGVTPPTYPTLSPFTSVSLALALSQSVGATSYTESVSTAVWLRNKL